MIRTRGFIPICTYLLCIGRAGTRIEAGHPRDRQPGRRCLFDLHIGNRSRDAAADEAGTGQ